MRWLRILLTGALAIVGGVFGSLLATGVADSWGHHLAFWRIAGSVSGIGLVLALDAGMGYVVSRCIDERSRAELLRQMQSHRRELRRLQESYESGLPWTSARSARMLAHRRRLDEIKDRLGPGRKRIPYDAIDDYPIPHLAFLQRVKAFLWRHSRVLYSFPLLLFLALRLSPVSERLYLAYVAVPTPPPTPTTSSAPLGFPTPAGTPTRDPRVPTPTFTLTPSPAPTVASTPTGTPTQTTEPTPPSTPTGTPTQTTEPTPTSTPTGTPTQTTGQTSEPASPETSPPVSDGTPLPPSTAAPLPAPMLIEPESGAAFPGRVRFKFSWPRELAEHERFSIYLESADGRATSDWRPSMQEILSGGGTVYPIADGYRFEVNGGIGALPPGEAFWRVAVFSGDPGTMEQITPWSEERLIFRSD